MTTRQEQFVVEIKSFIKKIIPNPLKPVVHKIYRQMFDGSTKVGFSREQFKDLAALKCAVSYNRYGGYCVPLSSRHRPAAKKIMSNDVYEPKTIEFILSNYDDGDVVQAGTYFGDFLPALSKVMSPSSKIWAFEPNKENYRCAKITLELNSIENVELTNAGIGAKKEKLFLQTIDEAGRSLGGASRITSVESNAAEAVQIVTIDDIIGHERNVSIIQLDVEGHEKEALTGALRTIKRCLPIIILEVLPNSNLIESDWFSANILNLGYQKTNEVHGNSVFSCETKHQ